MIGRPRLVCEENDGQRLGEGITQRQQAEYLRRIVTQPKSAPFIRWSRPSKKQAGSEAKS